jgi:polygalacturonase
MTVEKDLYQGNEWIQKEIDRCHETGGGIVTLKKGTYQCSSVELKSNVTLNIPKGTTLTFIHEQKNKAKADIPSFMNSEYNGNPQETFIFAKHADNISIVGEGTIDGGEEQFYGDANQYHIEGAYYPRPPMIFMEDCQRVTIQAVTLTKCAFWTVHLVGCRDVLIQAVRILNNLKMANCDGIDPDHCQDVRISDCQIECGDDCIVLKNSQAFQKYGPTKNIVVQNCIMTSTSAAIKIGTESESDFENVYFQNCIIKNTNRGIGIQLRDQGNVRNINFSDMFIDTRSFSNEWWGNGEPISITAFRRKEDTQLGHIADIHFRNITTNASNGVVVACEKKGDISGVDFDHCHFTIANKSKWLPDGIDYRPNPKTYYKNEGQPQAIHVHNAQHVTFEQSTVTVQADVRAVVDNSQDYL